MNSQSAKEFISMQAKKIHSNVISLTHSPIIRNFFIYSFGHIILRSITFILMPFALALLTPSDYGLLSLAISFANIFIVFLSLGLRQVFSIEYFHHDEQGQKNILNDIMLIFITFALPILLILSFNTHIINEFVFVGCASKTLIHLSLIFCFFYFFSELFYQVMQYQCKAFELTLLQSSVAIITILCNIIFLFLLRWGIEGMMGGYVLGLLIVVCIAAREYIKQEYFVGIDYRKSITQFFKYASAGFPFIPNIIFSWILSYGNRWVLAHYASLHDVGIYSLADTFSSLYQMLIIYPLSCSYLPLLFKKYAENKHDLASIEQWNKKNMAICMLSMLLIITIGYSVCKPLAYKILPFKYHEALNYGLYILIGNVFLMGTTFASCLIQFHKKTYFLALAVCIPAIINLTLNTILIPHYTIYGCVIATMVAYASYWTITMAYNYKLARDI